MVKASIPPCLFHYHNGFDKHGCQNLANNSTRPVMKIFILINYVYFGCLAALFLYDVLFYKIFSFGRFVFTNCFKKCPACDELKNVKKEKRRISFSLPAPEDHPSQQRLAAWDQTIISDLKGGFNPSENTASGILRLKEDPNVSNHTSRLAVSSENLRMKRGEYANGEESPTKAENSRSSLIRSCTNGPHASSKDHEGIRPNLQQSHQTLDNGRRERSCQSGQQKGENPHAENPHRQYVGAKNIECPNLQQPSVPISGRDFSTGENPEAEKPRLHHQNNEENRGPGGRPTVCARSREGPQNECAKPEPETIDDIGDGGLTPESGAPGFGVSEASLSGSEFQTWNAGKRHEPNRENPIRSVTSDRDADLKLLPSFVRSILRNGAGTESDGPVLPECRVRLEMEVAHTEQDILSCKSPTSVHMEPPRRIVP